MYSIASHRYISVQEYTVKALEETIQNTMWF